MARLVVRDIVITTMLLGLFAAIGTGVVAWVHSGTEARIAENRLAMTRMRVTQVLEGVDYDNDPVMDHHKVGDDRLGGQNLSAWLARRDGEVVGVALSAVAPDGYSGDIRMLVGIDTSGTLLGVRVTGHRETPGLGDDIEVERSDWIHAFRGRSLTEPPIELWRVRRDGGIFDQFTGATVTPRAVVRAVRNALLYFEEHAEELLALPLPEDDAVLTIKPITPEIPDHRAPVETLPGAGTVEEPTQ